LIHSAVFLLLPPNVIPDEFFVSTYRRSEIASCPEVLTSKVPDTACKIPGNVDCALALYVTYDLSYRILWRDRDIHMDVISAQMSFQYLTLSLPGQLSDDLPKMSPNPTIQHLSAILGYPNNVVLAVPNRMT
jgi:hypothetical protein